MAKPTSQKVGLMKPAASHAEYMAPHRFSLARRLRAVLQAPAREFTAIFFKAQRQPLQGRAQGR